MKNMNLKQKCKPSWHSFFNRNFIAIYLALALVLVINQVIFSYALKDRENARAITSSMAGDMFWTMPNMTATRGANDVVLARGIFPDATQNENVACSYELQGNPCINVVDSDGVDSPLAGTDDDGVTMIFKLPTYLQPLNNMLFQASDHMCTNSLTSPTCIWQDSDGDCNIGTGTPTYILGGPCAGFTDIDLSTATTLPEIFAHSEVVKQNGAYDFCGGPNSPACPQNASNTLRVDTTGTKCGPIGNGAIQVPVWDDITGDNVFTPGVDTIYFDPNHCLSGVGACASGGCAGVPTGHPLLVYLSTQSGCQDRVWDDRFSNDGVFTLGVDLIAWDPTHCLTNGMAGVRMIDPAKYTETTWHVNFKYDDLLKQGSDWNTAYIGQFQGYLAPAWTAVETYKDSGAGFYNGTEPVVLDYDLDGTYSAGDADVYGIGGLTLGDSLTQLSVAIGPSSFPLIKTQAGGLSPMIATEDSILEDDGNITTGTAPNGHIDRVGDILDRGMFAFTGSLVPERDITNVRLYADFTNSGVCDATSSFVTNLTYNGTNYINTVSPFPALTIPICLVADIPGTAIGGSTGYLKIPQLYDANSNGLYDNGDAGFFFYSGNNGPRDADMIFPYSITIVPLPRTSGGNTVPDTTPPGVPENVSITASSTGSVAITWTDPSDADLSQIEIYETYLGNSVSSAVDKGVQSFNLANRQVGGEYEYALRAIDTVGNKSSQVVYTITIPASGEITVNQPIYLPAPTPPTGSTPENNLILHDPTPAGSLLANVQVGTLVKRADISSVYFIDQDNRRHAFPNEATYFSWFSDFSGIQTISADTLAAIPLGSNVTIRPGTYLVKIQTDPKVYAVEPYGVIRWVSSEAIANKLYGSDWSKRIIDVNDTFFVDYQVGASIDTAIHPTGSVISYVGDTATYYIDNGVKKYLTSSAFSGDKLQNKFVIRNVGTDLVYTAGADYPLLPMETLMTLR
jgi:hypothetical protein